MNAAALDVKTLAFHHPAGHDGPGFALDVESLTLARGERVACIGPSGSGKTTLIHLLTGILTPERGRVTAGDFDLTAASDAARRAWRIRHVGLVFQEFELLDYLPAIENILLPYLVSPALRLDRAARARAQTLAQSTGIDRLLGRRPKRLSHGERQRIAICRALVTNPTLLVCDEPTGSLDPDSGRAVLDLLIDHALAGDHTLLVVTHDHEVLDRFDRVIDMTRLVTSGAPS